MDTQQTTRLTKVQMVLPMSLEGCVSVSVVAIASGGSDTKGATLSRCIQEQKPKSPQKLEELKFLKEKNPTKNLISFGFAFPRPIFVSGKCLHFTPLQNARGIVWSGLTNKWTDLGQFVVYYRIFKVDYCFYLVVWQKIHQEVCILRIFKCTKLWRPIFVDLLYNSEPETTNFFMYYILYCVRELDWMPSILIVVFNFGF